MGVGSYLIGDGNSFPLVCAVVTGNFGVQKYRAM